VPDVERSRVEAGRRARTKLRRYCAANRLNRFGTLTYAGAGCFDQQELRRDLGGFFKGLRGELGGKPLPYAWAPECIQEATGCMCTSRSAATSVDANGNNLTAIAPNGTTTNSYDALNPFGAAWGGIRL